MAFLTPKVGVTRKGLTIALAIIAASGGSYAGYNIYKQGSQANENTVEAMYAKEVLDGDTFVLENGEHIRLSEIDAPEKGSCYANEAKNELEEILRGQPLRLTKDIQGSDNFDRLIRYVVILKDGEREDNVLINRYMLEQGLAKYSRGQNTLHKQEFAQVESAARTKGVGLWGHCPGEMSQSEIGSGRRLENSTGPTDPKCLIKGNISVTFGRKYLLPHCANYEITKIDTDKGEAYFCSELAAQKAGFLATEGCK